MAKKYTGEAEAIKTLSKFGITVGDGKTIHAPGGTSGLSACSAIDFLVNHHKYHVTYASAK